MKQTINSHDFINAFSSHDRMSNFEYDGLQALFTWLEDFEKDTDSELELDVIELCCDFTRYNSITEFNAYYTLECETIDDVSEHTIVIPIDDDAFIIQNI